MESKILIHKNMLKHYMESDSTQVWSKRKKAELDLWLVWMGAILSLNYSKRGEI